MGSMVYPKGAYVRISQALLDHGLSPLPGVRVAAALTVDDAHDSACSVSLVRLFRAPTAESWAGKRVIPP
jgi:hypothetical protein